MWIRTVEEGEATGRLAELYAAARGRAGRVFAIVRTMSLSPAALDASMQLYLSLMKGPSELSRARRELLATVVSKVNSCDY